MIDLENKNYCPTIEEISEYVKNPVFMQFYSDIKDAYQCNEKIEFSSCSWERGWNVKFKKAGKTLCTIYPKECCLKLMVVIGKKEKALVEAMLPDCTVELNNIYNQTREGNGQRWLIIELEDKDSLYNDILRLIEVRNT